MSKLLHTCVVEEGQALGLNFLEHAKVSEVHFNLSSAAKSNLMKRAGFATTLLPLIWSISSIETDLRHSFFYFLLTDASRPCIDIFSMILTRYHVAWFGLQISEVHFDSQCRSVTFRRGSRSVDRENEMKNE